MPQNPVGHRNWCHGRSPVLSCLRTFSVPSFVGLFHQRCYSHQLRQLIHRFQAPATSLVEHGQILNQYRSTSIAADSLLSVCSGGKKTHQDISPGEFLYFLFFRFKTMQFLQGSAIFIGAVLLAIRAILFKQVFTVGANESHRISCCEDLKLSHDVMLRRYMSVIA